MPDEDDTLPGSAKGLTVGRHPKIHFKQQGGAPAPASRPFFMSP